MANAILNFHFDFPGTSLSNHNGICKKPCKTLSTSLSGRVSPLPKSYSNFVAFNFQPVVQVTKSIPKVTFMNVINDAGSSSGLWLGASVFSIFKMFQTGSFCCCFRGHAYKTVREHLTIVAAMFATMWCISLGFIFIFHYF